MRLNRFFNMGNRKVFSVFCRKLFPFPIGVLLVGFRYFLLSLNWKWFSFLFKAGAHKTWMIKLTKPLVPSRFATPMSDHICLDFWVATAMFGYGKHFKIFNSIVRWIAVNMMDNFFSCKKATKMFFYYKTMFKNIAKAIGIWMAFCEQFSIPAFYCSFSAFPIPMFIPRTTTRCHI